MTNVLKDLKIWMEYHPVIYLVEYSYTEVVPVMAADIMDHETYTDDMDLPTLQPME